MAEPAWNCAEFARQGDFGSALYAAQDDGRKAANRAALAVKGVLSPIDQAGLCAGLEAMATHARVCLEAVRAMPGSTHATLQVR